MYQSIKKILFRFDPELVHDTTIAFGEFFGSTVLGRSAIGHLFDYKGKDISKIVDGIRYRTPIILSAGFDCNGRLTRILPMVGFGGEEIGSITARPCAGNPKPRLRRLVKSKSILVHKGLRNDGVDAVIARLTRTSRIPDFVLGISIAQTNDGKTCTVEQGIEDYAYSFKKLNEAHAGDYYTINISCPNAVMGEVFTNPENLDCLLAKLKEIPCAKPVYVKMPINATWEEHKARVDLVVKHGLNGVVIGNLNKNYDELDFRAEAPEKYSGGISGKPTFARSNNLIKKTREHYGKDLTIIGSGGILAPGDAREKLEAGADLLQIATGMIWNGPGFMKKIAKAIAARS